MLDFQKIVRREDFHHLPYIIDELGALECIKAYGGIHIAHLDDLWEFMIPWVSLFEKRDEKKHLSVEDIRIWIGEISEIPYEKKHLYILRDFDLATLPAMNASLKILEEPPPYAIILLIVSNPETLLETIRSRCVNLFQKSGIPLVSEFMQKMVEDFRLWKNNAFLSTIFEKKFERDEVYEILTALSKEANHDELAILEQAYIDLFTTNESPRNILDRGISKLFL